MPLLTVNPLVNIVITGSLMLGNSMDTSCVVDPDPTKRVFSLQQCGNGVVEAGEDCDPGSGPNAASSPCCDAATCKFKLGAQCDPSSSPCCTPQCRFAPTSQVCRPARDDQCDVPEVCSGLSATCPTDKTMPNGEFWMKFIYYHMPTGYSRTRLRKELRWTRLC